jgi:hypothetical protein
MDATVKRRSVTFFSVSLCRVYANPENKRPLAVPPAGKCVSVDHIVSVDVDFWHTLARRFWFVFEVVPIREVLKESNTE